MLVVFNTGTGRIAEDFSKIASFREKDYETGYSLDIRYFNMQTEEYCIFFDNKTLRDQAFNDILHAMNDGESLIFCKCYEESLVDKYLNN